MSTEVTEDTESAADTGDGDTGEETPQDRRMQAKASRASAREESDSSSDSQTVRLRVYRYDPDVEAKQDPRYDDFHVPFDESTSVLDALIYARDEFDSSLTFRHSCRQAVCGSDALLINGQQRLGCKTRVSDLSHPIRIEPLPHQDVVKDLVVDMEHFYDQMESVEPYFDPADEPPGELEEYRQSRENREKIKLSTRCIWCAACMSSCSIAATDNEYLGPAAINKSYRFLMDEREGDERKQERLETLEADHAVWRCQTQFSCTQVCPKDIPLTEHIQEVKREAVKSNLKFW